MNIIKLDYGKDGLEINLDSSLNIDIIKPKKLSVINNPVETIRKNIREPYGCPPLLEIMKNKRSVQSVCIVVCDATRPIPTHIILEALIKELNDYGVKKSQITILIATGLHRPSTLEEIEHIIGKKKVLHQINILNHNAKNKSEQIYLGDLSDGNPIYINKHFYKSDLKILTGYVEPHFFCGFSGGRKLIVPGISGEDTIMVNHSADKLSSQFSRFGIYEENPIHQHSLEIAKKVNVDFIVNVCINEKHEITQIATGDLENAHEYLVKYQMNNIFREILEPFDIVICGNGGFPLDLNLYQAIKSMAIGEIIVKQGGTIISVNELSEGIGIGQENFKELIYSGKKPKILNEQVQKKEIIVPDQWQIQVLTRIMMKVDIYVISLLKKEEIGNIGLKYADSVETAIEECLQKYGKNARILILPNGPQVIPLLNEKKNY